MSFASLTRHIDRSEAFRARVRAGLRAEAPAYDARIVSWPGSMSRHYSATIKAAGTSIPEGTIVLAVRKDEHGRRVAVLIEAYEGDRAAFASFPRLAQMLGATELEICAAGGTVLDRLVVARDLAWHARFDRAALLARPLVVAGAFDRSAIMATACAAAKARQSLSGETWGVCLSAALKGTWALARAARLAAAH